MPIVDPQVTSIFSAGCALASTACAVWIAMRDSRWRKHGLAKQLEDRIAVAQKSADDWHLTGPAVAMRAELDRQGDAIVGHGASIQQCASRADLMRVEGMVKETKSLVTHAAAGVDRIEGILIRRALVPDRVTT